MTRSGIDALRRLTATGGAVPRLPADPLGRDELTPDIATVVWVGGPRLDVANALYSLWLDVRRGREIPGTLLQVALLRTGELLAEPSRFEPMNVREALDEAFGAVASQRVMHRLPKEAWEAFEQALLEAIVATEDRLPINAAGLGTLSTIINTVASVVPGTAGTSVFRFPLGSTQKLSEWTIAYLSVLAYRTADNPIITQPVYLWERLGQDYGVRFSGESRRRVQSLLDERTIERVLRECEPHVTPIFRDASREIRLLQLDMDYVVRRGIFLEKLTSDQPSPWWDDEYGTVAP